jgi:hypothetical protein
MLFVSCGKKRTVPPEEIAYFDQLVAVLDSSEHYHKLQELKLTEYKRKAEEATAPEAAYYYYKLIAENLYEFNLDSAQYYIDKNFEIARKNHKTEWMTDCYLLAAHRNNKGGFFEQTREALDHIAGCPKTINQQLSYYLESIDYWSNRAVLLNTPNPDPICQAFADSILAMGDVVPLPIRMHAEFWKEADDARKPALLDRYRAVIDQMSPDDTFYSTACSDVGMLYHILGLNEMFEVEYLTKYLCANIRKVSRVATLLTYLEQIAIKHGEIEYANRFLSACVQMQQDYPDRIHLPLYYPISELNDVIIDKLKSESKRNSTLMMGCLIMLTLVGVLLVLTFVNLRHRIRLESLVNEKNLLLEEHAQELKDEQRRLHDANHALEEKSQELKEEGERLREANFLKEEYIGLMFATCSEYLQKISAVKKNINRKLVARQYEMAMEMTSGKSDADAKEQHELWAKFDEVFLQLFPDFVEQFNELLRPEERIALRSGERMNTDLRIYALVRLGINNSVKISKILGLSTQSVYNARQKMRSRATESKEEFPVRVRNLAISYNLIEPR